MAVPKPRHGGNEKHKKSDENCRRRLLPPSWPPEVTLQASRASNSNRPVAVGSVTHAAFRLLACVTDILWDTCPVFPCSFLAITFLLRFALLCVSVYPSCEHQKNLRNNYRLDTLLLFTARDFFYLTFHSGKRVFGMGTGSDCALIFGVNISLLSYGIPPVSKFRR